MVGEAGQTRNSVSRTHNRKQKTLHSSAEGYTEGLKARICVGRKGDRDGRPISDHRIPRNHL